MINNIECICEVCNSSFLRKKAEFKRSQKLNRKSYCSRKCSGIGNGEKTKNNLKHYLGDSKLLKSDNRKDSYSPYRYFLRAAKRRYKEVNIGLQDLKDIWEQQSGRCPLTGKQLSLKHNNSPYQASLDRIDSNKGYVKGNIRYIALIANYCKNSFTDEDVKEFCNSVATFSNR